MHCAISTKRSRRRAVLTAVAKTLTDTEAVPATHCMMGLSFHFSGQHADARGYLELVAKSRPTAHLVNVRRSGVNFRINALCTLARILWLQGHCDAAFRAARDVVSEGQVGGNMMSYTMALALTIPVHLWRGDNAIAEEIINHLIDLARRHGLGPTLAVGQGWQGALATIDGRAVDGVQLLGTSIQSLQDTNYRITATVFRGFCAAGLAANGDIDSALSSIDLAIDEIARDGDLAYMPELLRIKGTIEILSGDFQSGETSLPRSTRRGQAANPRCRGSCAWPVTSRISGGSGAASTKHWPFFRRYTTVSPKVLIPVICGPLRCCWKPSRAGAGTWLICAEWCCRLIQFVPRNITQRNTT